jgi:hypothetical protein
VVVAVAAAAFVLYFYWEKGGFKGCSNEAGGEDRKERLLPSRPARNSGSGNEPVILSSYISDDKPDQIWSLIAARRRARLAAEAAGQSESFADRCRTAGISCPLSEQALTEEELAERKAQMEVAMAERKAQEEAMQQWSAFERALQDEKRKAGAQLAEAVATKQFAKTAGIHRREDELDQILQQGCMLKQQARSGQAEQRELKRQLAELHCSIAHRLQGLHQDDQDEPVNFKGLSNAGASDDKFTAAKIVTGRPELAAKGLVHFMGISMKREGEILQQGLDAIREEFEQPSTAPEMRELMHYVLDEAAIEQMPGAGGGVVKEKGNDGKRLHDFLRDPHAVSAELEAAHIAALRLYTSDAYTCINDPLRNGCSDAEPHPFAATTLFLSDALKKLRVNNGADSSQATKRKEFWRGMKVSYNLWPNLS